MKQREIKFRAWNKEEKRMVIWKDIIEFAKTIETISNSYLASLDNFIFLQYTGLKDKNGKEIYEGDIVREIDKQTEAQDTGIVWMSEQGMWIFGEPQKCGECFLVGDSFYCEYEIIGNIYENPEMSTTN